MDAKSDTTKDAASTAMCSLKKLLKVPELEPIIVRGTYNLTLLYVTTLSLFLEGCTAWLDMENLLPQLDDSFVLRAWKMIAYGKFIEPQSRSSSKDEGDNCRQFRDFLWRTWRDHYWPWIGGGGDGERVSEATPNQLLAWRRATTAIRLRNLASQVDPDDAVAIEAYRAAVFEQWLPFVAPGVTELAFEQQLAQLEFEDILDVVDEAVEPAPIFPGGTLPVGATPVGPLYPESEHLEEVFNQSMTQIQTAIANHLDKGCRSVWQKHFKMRFAAVEWGAVEIQTASGDLAGTGLPSHRRTALFKAIELAFANRGTFRLFCLRDGDVDVYVTEADFRAAATAGTVLNLRYKKKVERVAVLPNAIVRAIVGIIDDARVERAAFTSSLESDFFAGFRALPVLDAHMTVPARTMLEKDLRTQLKNDVGSLRVGSGPDALHLRSVRESLAAGREVVLPYFAGGQFVRARLSADAALALEALLDATMRKQVIIRLAGGVGGVKDWNRQLRYIQATNRCILALPPLPPRQTSKWSKKASKKPEFANQEPATETQRLLPLSTFRPHHIHIKSKGIVNLHAKLAKTRHIPGWSKMTETQRFHACFDVDGVFLKRSDGEDRYRGVPRTFVNGISTDGWYACASFIKTVPKPPREKKEAEVEGEKEPDRDVSGSRGAQESHSKYLAEVYGRAVPVGKGKGKAKKGRGDDPPPAPGTYDDLLAREKRGELRIREIVVDPGSNELVFGIELPEKYRSAATPEAVKAILDGHRYTTYKYTAAQLKWESGITKRMKYLEQLKKSTPAVLAAGE